MAKLNRATGLPSQGELYPKGVGDWVWDHSLGWVLDHKITSGIVTTAVAGAITAGILLSAGGSTKEAINTNSQSGQTGSSQTTGQTASEIYYSQVRASLLQDVPELTNYRSALDYTTQRIVDMKNAYNLNLDQVRAPMTKWVQANIDWDKKGERLIPLSEGTNFLPYAMFRGNFTTNDKVNGDLASINTKSKNVPLDALTTYVDELIIQHDQIWFDLNDPKKLTLYLDTSNGEVPLPFTKETAAMYKSAILEYGTLQDKQSWALLGRLSHIERPEGSNEELRRNEQYLFSLLAVGGDGRVEENTQSWDNTNYKGSNKMLSVRHDRQTSFRMSNQLKNAIASRPGVYRKPLDPDYLAPNLPSFEAIERTRGWVSPETGVVLLDMPYVFAYNGLDATNLSKFYLFLVGDPQTARKFGDTRF